MLPTVTTLVKTTKKHRVSLTGRELCQLLRAAGLEIPKDASVTVTVPSGAGWAGLDIDTDSHAPIDVRWTVKSEAQE